jgi:oxygen-independent coproporphyrinogen-3 oxidase
MNMLDPIILKHEHRRVPRYTSYPTAPHFTAAIDEDVYRAWLAELSRGGPLSLYIHVPFCQTLCWYCGCHTRGTMDYAPVSRYLEALTREIDLLADALPTRMQVGHVHWGGGTPSIVRPEDFLSVMTVLRQRFSFRRDAEVAVEIDPRVLHSDTLDAFRLAGVTRASVGVQSFDPAVQEAINRVQSFAQTRNAVDALRAAGIRHINIDLVYGLPLQTLENSRETAVRAAELTPDRFAVFGYAHVPTFKPHQRLIDEAALPTAPERLDQYQAIAETLSGQGYVAVGLDHFARADDALAMALGEGTLRRNFQGYTADPCETLLGLGASSIGSLPAGYVQNEPRVPEYQTIVAADRLPIVRGRYMTREDRVRRDVIESLMAYLRVDLDRIAARHGLDVGHFTHDLASLAEYEADGLVRLHRNEITVPDRYRPLIRSVAAVFDTYLQPDEGRHARAI